MRIDFLPRYLIGQRQAILDLAADRRAIWVGALFVLSAGFAREYDGKDLLHEPWHLLIPFVSSLGAASVLFVMAAGKMLLNGETRPQFGLAFRGFLTLFWMTAPMAWIYAIPYERFLSPYGALIANLITLGIVAVWRVVLMMRVVSVVFGYSPMRAIFVVLAFADAVALSVAYMMPAPVISFMGGIRLTKAEELIQTVQLNLFCWGFLAVPVAVILALVAVLTTWPTWQAPPAPSERSRGLLWAGIASVVAWALVLPFTQDEQIRQWRIEHRLKNGRIAEGLELMSRYDRADFAPDWDPPPQFALRKRSPHILDVMDQILNDPPAPWVRDLYVEKFIGYLEDVYNTYHNRPQEIPRIAAICGRLDQPLHLKENCRMEIEEILLYSSVRSPEDRQVKRALFSIFKRVANKPDHIRLAAIERHLQEGEKEKP